MTLKKTLAIGLLTAGALGGAASPAFARGGYVCSTFYTPRSDRGTAGSVTIHFYTQPRCAGAFAGTAYSFSSGYRTTSTLLVTHALFSELANLELYRSAQNAAYAGKYFATSDHYVTFMGMAVAQIYELGTNGI